MQRLWGALLGTLVAGCAVEPADHIEQTELPGAPGSPGGVAAFDFSCVDMPHPARATESLSLTGFTNDSYSGGALSDVSVDLITAEANTAISTTWSDADGRLGFEIATGSEPIRTYARMNRPGHVTSYLYPSHPLWRDEANVFFPVLPPAWRDELAAYTGVMLDASRGIVAVIVTDCAGERVEGATVTFDPPAEAIAYWDPTFTDPGDGATSVNGHAWGFNVPAGEVRATITIGDVTYRDWPVQSFAEGRTLSWRAP